jgi:hypothetical protein
MSRDDRTAHDSLFRADSVIKLSRRDAINFTKREALTQGPARRSHT